MRFNPLRKEIADRITGVGYGLVLSSSGTMTDDVFDYVAAVEVRTFAGQPDGLLQITTPEQLYAVFEKRGLADKSKMSLDYIYGYWLPYSGYTRARGYDFEIFDHRTRLDNPDSISFHCIPIDASPDVAGASSRPKK